METDLKKIISRCFWESGSISVSVDKPFRMTSGKYSPFYIDCRVLISFPLYRELINAHAQWLLFENEIHTDFIAGGETAGIPFAAWLAERMYKPFIYVRKKPKGHGLTSQLEGKIDSGCSVLLYEDLITDGMSKLNFIHGIRAAGCKVNHCLVLLDRQQGGAEKLSEEDVRLYSLVTISECLNVGLENHYLSTAEMDSIRTYLKDGEI